MYALYGHDVMLDDLVYPIITYTTYMWHRENKSVQLFGTIKFDWNSFKSV